MSKITTIDYHRKKLTGIAKTQSHSATFVDCHPAFAVMSVTPSMGLAMWV